MLFGVLGAHLGMLAAGFGILILVALPGTSDSSNSDQDRAFSIPALLWVGVAVLLVLLWLLRLRRFAWLVAPSVAWLLVSLLIGVSYLDPSTDGFAPARQGETVQVDGGNLTTLGWCASADCPGGGAGVLRGVVKACATEDGWEIDEADFLAFEVETDESYPDDPTSRPGALGRRTLKTGACARGNTSFALSGTPQYLFYEGHGCRCRWELTAPAG